MKWAKNLFLSENAAEKKDIMKRKAKRGAGMFQVYFITLASNPENLFDIFHAAHIKQTAFMSQEHWVVGIACSMEEAKELVTRMVDTIYKETGGFAVRDYFIFSK